MPSLLTRKIVICFVLLFFAANAFADVPPDPGYVRQSANLILETEDDLSGFRFFLESPMEIEEVKIVKGVPTTIEAANRGGAVRFGKLIAIPLTDLSLISGDLSGPLLETLIRQKKFPNAKELLSHNFQATISYLEQAAWKDPVYRISLSKGLIVAEKVSKGAGSNSVIPFSFWQIVLPVAVAGVLLAVAIAILGIWLIRRSSKKV
ncbi:MAG TPA: hypothetical protein VK612_13785 [Pyrinomonadaceae bacterium]|nr:hypothetical protein [Pyrinomonadaceae bacterium]